MNLEYSPDPPACDVFTFAQLVPGTWYQGVQTGQLYFFYTATGGGERHLLRAEDNCLCSERYQHGGTFRPVQVTVVVHARKPREDGHPCGR